MEVMEPPSKAATTRTQPERDGSTISASGGKAHGARDVSFERHFRYLHYLVIELARNSLSLRGRFFSAAVVWIVPGNPHGTRVSRVFNNTGKRDSADTVPNGKAELLKTRTQVVLLPDFEPSYHLGLPRATEPLGLFTQGLPVFRHPLGQVTRPVFHRDTAMLEQVRAGIGCLHPVPDYMHQGRLDNLPWMIDFLTCPAPSMAFAVAVAGSATGGTWFRRAVPF